MSPVIALLGGESTGKSTLAQQLVHHLRATHGLHSVVVPEQLRLWCQAEGRAPRADEQAAIARAQTEAIEAAAQTGADLVIADTTALVVAAYSRLYFRDDTLLAAARQQQQRYALTLLMGLDLPWVPDGLFRDGPTVRDATDALLRDALAVAGVRFETVYGHGTDRVKHALRALRPLLGSANRPDPQHPLESACPWWCEVCSDPASERRLFQRLLTPPAA